MDIKYTIDELTALDWNDVKAIASQLHLKVPGVNRVTLQERIVVASSGHGELLNVPAPTPTLSSVIAPTGSLADVLSGKAPTLAEEMAKLEAVDPEAFTEMRERLEKTMEAIEEDAPIPYAYERPAELRPWAMLDLDTGPLATPKPKPSPVALIEPDEREQLSVLPPGGLILTYEQIALCYMAIAAPSGFVEKGRVSASYVGGNLVRISLPMGSGDVRYIVTMPEEISVEARPCV